MNWYLLPCDCQKQISGVIHRLQNGAALTIGPFVRIDFVKAADVRFPWKQQFHIEVQAIFSFS